MSRSMQTATHVALHCFSRAWPPLASEEQYKCEAPQAESFSCMYTTELCGRFVAYVTVTAV